MANALASFDDFDAALVRARIEIERMAQAEPDDAAIESVRLQLAALHEWTRGGRCPAQDEKDRLDFGQIASRELDAYPVAAELYRLASFVTWWGERRELR
jgi:hypothetical protein